MRRSIDPWTAGDASNGLADCQYWEETVTTFRRTAGCAGPPLDGRAFVVREFDIPWPPLARSLHAYEKIDLRLVISNAWHFGLRCNCATCLPPILKRAKIVTDKLYRRSSWYCPALMGALGFCGSRLLVTIKSRKCPISFWTSYDLRVQSWWCQKSVGSGIIFKCARSSVG
jgi:hypothetical protein